MAVNWNPDAPDTLGPQWQPSSESAVVLDARSKMVAQSIDQTGVATIGTIRVAVGAIPSRGGVYAVEVYDNETGEVDESTRATLTARPNEDVTLNGWKEDDDTAASIYAEIDEATYDPSDYIKSPTGAPALATAQYVHRYSTAGLSLTGKRPLSVSIGVVLSSVPLSKINNVLNVALRIGGVLYNIGRLQARSSTVDIGYITLLHNPANGRAWTIADVQAFDGPNDAVVFYVDNVPYSRVYIYQAWMDVEVCTETRIAVGYLDDRSNGLTENAWNATTTMLTPTGGAWAKDGAGRHLYTVRRTYDRGSLAIPRLEERGVIPNPASGFTPVVDSSFGYITDMGDEHGKLFGLIQRTTVPAEHLDSISYADALAADVYTGVAAQMEYTSGGAGNFGIVRARVKSNAASAALTIKIKKRSDSSQVGSTYTLTAADAAELIEDAAGWKYLTAELSAVAALTATQFYVEFTSLATGVGDDKWSVLALDTLDQGNGATYGGTTDRALVNGTEADRYDLAVTIATIPTAVAGFTTSLLTQALDGDCGLCGVEQIEYVHGTWTATALGADFGYYQVDRSEDGGTTWDTYAKIVTEAVTAFSDYDSKRGVEACYRIRVVRSDEAPSAWSASSCETPTAQACEWLFVSSHEPALNVGYMQAGPETTYSFPNAQEREHLAIYGRDGKIALVGTEDLLVDFTLTLIVQAEDTDAPAAEGVSVFDPLRALMNADVPYVAVLDSAGNRFYADIAVPEGDADREVNYYTADVEIVELTLSPTPIA